MSANTDFEDFYQDGPPDDQVVVPEELLDSEPNIEDSVKDDSPTPSSANFKARAEESQGEDLFNIERAFIGCMLQNNQLASVGLKFLKPEQFVEAKCRLIARAIEDIADTGGVVQTHTIIEYLRNHKTQSGKIYTQIVSPEDVHSIALSAPSDPAFETYAKAIEDRWQRGQLEDLTAHVHAGLVRGDISDAADAKRMLEQKLIELAGDQISNKVSDLIQSYFAVIQSITYDIEHQGEIVGAATGIDGLDEITGGLRPGQLIVLAGTPGSGKTSLAMNIASCMVFDINQPVVFFSLEMSDKELAQRIISSQAEIPYAAIRDRKLSESDWETMAKLRKQFRGAPLKIIDEPDVGFLDVKSYAYEMMGLYDKPPIIIVDYLQLMNLNSNNRYSHNRNEAIGDITRGLKILANDLETTVIVLSQLTKQSSFRDNKRPQLNDLRDSGSIGQDADMVIFTYRDDTFYPGSGDQGIAELIVEKHRAGGNGTLYLGFMKQFAKFVNLADPRHYGRDGANVTGRALTAGGEVSNTF